MARDRSDDYDDRRDDLDDRGRDRDRGERGRDDYDDRPRSGDRAGRGRPAASRATTSVPGVLLMICGGICGLLSAYNVYNAVTNPEQLVTQYGDQIRQIEATQPAGPQRDQQVKMLKTIQEYARLDSPAVLALIGVGAVSAGLMLLGGWKLYTRSGYGLALTGAIVALIPCSNGLVCLAMPIGLYALIVLLGGDGKAAFRRPAADPLDRLE